MTFYATSGWFPLEQRTFNRFSDLTNEVLEARIWAGIHFRAADEQAAKLGRKVERYVHQHLFCGPKKHVGDRLNLARVRFPLPLRQSHPDRGGFVERAGRCASPAAAATGEGAAPQGSS